MEAGFRVGFPYLRLAGKMETTIMDYNELYRVQGLQVRIEGGNERMKKKMETATMGFMGTTISIHSFIPSELAGRRSSSRIQHKWS